MGVYKWGVEMGHRDGTDMGVRVQREQMPRKWRKKGDEEDRDCDGKTAWRLERDLEELREECRKRGKYRRNLILDRERSDR